MSCSSDKRNWLGLRAVVVASASLVRSFGVTASRRSGRTSHVPEDILEYEAVFIKSSLG